MIREVSCEAPRSCPGAKASRPVTRRPRLAACQAVELPSAPRPMTARSHVSAMRAAPFEPGEQPTTDVHGRILHRREPAPCVVPRGHSALHGLADRPVLAVHQIPEIACVAG